MSIRIKDLIFLMKTKMINTELEYLKCFCQYENRGSFTEFSDPQISDMYSHNLIYLTQPLSPEKFREIVNAELIKRKEEGHNFLNLRFDFPFDPAFLKGVEHQPQWMTTYGFYYFPLTEYDKLNPRKDCEIIPLNSKHLDEAIQLDLEVGEEECGADFVKRRFERRSKVYLAPGPIENYLLIHNDRVIGHMDLFIKDSVMKIEDFDITPALQRNGFGTFMLKEAVKIALKNKLDLVYLITGEEDTAKDMYRKCGMKLDSTSSEIPFYF